MSEYYSEWGQHSVNENYYLEASVAPGGVYDVYFNVGGAQTIYTYFDLYDFTDDLDLDLFRYNELTESYDSIKKSQEAGSTEEELFQGLVPGDYILEISHYEDLDGYNSDSGFSVGFDSVTYYENATSADETSGNIYEWGQHSVNENSFLEASVAPGGVYDIYFNVGGAQTIYTYFDLYGFTDDLDITLFKYNGVLNEYENIATAQEEGSSDETLFKGLVPGDYILEISHYEDLDGYNSDSSFSVGFDSVSYYESAVLPDDTLFPSQWHLINTGQAGGIDDEDIMAPEAWSYRTNASEIVVAVIDGGIQTDHPDLEENIWINSDEIFGNGIDDDGNGYVDDLVGWNLVTNSPYVIPDDHGTHVAGTIGAKGNNSRGVTGVAWDVQLMSLDVFGGYDGASDSDIIEAIYYAVDNGAHVINMSLGYTHEYSTIDQWRIVDPNGYASYYEALKYAVDNDCTVVIAAGNEDLDTSIHLSIPAAFSSVLDGVISTAAVTNSGDLSLYTNYGSSVTIAAPGGNGDGVAGRGILSTVTNSRYDDISGTSMASPVVAGAAALIKAENNNFTPADIEEILTESAVKNRELNTLVEDGNYLDLNSALTLAKTVDASGTTPAPTPAPATEPTPTPEPTPGSDSVEVPTKKKWAKALWKFSGKDEIINVHIDSDGSFKNKSKKISKNVQAFYQSLFEEIETATELNINFTELGDADIIIHSTGKKGSTQKKRGYFDINGGKHGRKKINDHRREILAAFVLPCFGLALFREDDNHSSDDSLMSYYLSDNGYDGLTTWDIIALQSLW